MAKTPEIEGVKDTIKALRRINPELRKEFNLKVKAIAAPMTDAMKSEYSDNRFPSGTKRKWSTKDGRKLFPLTAAKAKTVSRLRSTPVTVTATLFMSCNQTQRPPFLIWQVKRI
jgi:hypothetical protein